MTTTSETAVPSPKGKKPIQILRERRGGVPRELLERNRRQKAVRKSIADALREGAQTIPELARLIDLPADETFWYVMGMKKYGTVYEAEQEDGYFRYALVRETRETENRS